MPVEDMLSELEHRCAQVKVTGMDGSWTVETKTLEGECAAVTNASLHIAVRKAFYPFSDCAQKDRERYSLRMHK